MSTPYLLRRIAQSAMLIFFVTLVVFLLLRITPGEPAAMMAGDYASQETVERIREALGLNKPLHTQYGIYLSRLVRGDLGTSIRAQRPVLEYILERFPATLELAVAALAFALLLGVPLGVLSAARRYSSADNVSMLIAIVGQSAPGFWLGIMAIMLFAVQLRWLPTSGRGTPAHLILPAITLSLATLGLTIRLTRSGMLDVLGEDFIRTARAKGLAGRMILYKHALRNAIIPLVTIIGVGFGTMLGGAVVTETVFAWPGLGLLLIQAVLTRDYPLVQGIVLVAAVTFILVNFAVDLVYRIVDPRIRVEG